MSSTPFCLGLPVVDRLKATDMECVLRTKTFMEAKAEIRRIQNLLTSKDLIKVYIIGYRPDSPVPVAMCFTEIHITIGGAEDWIHSLGPYSGAWTCVVAGIKAVNK